MSLEAVNGYVKIETICISVVLYPLVLAVVGGHYYISQEATSFWEGRAAALGKTLSEVGNEAVERGREMIDEVAKEELVKRATELKRETKKELDKVGKKSND